MKQSKGATENYSKQCACKHDKIGFGWLYKYNIFNSNVVREFWFNHKFND